MCQPDWACLSPSLLFLDLLSGFPFSVLRGVVPSSSFASNPILTAVKQWQHEQA